MAWWQVALIIVGAVIIGVIAGYLVNVLIFSRLIPAFTKRKRTVKEKPVRAVDVPAVHSPPVSSFLSSLISEIEYNYHLSSSDWNGELQAFQTTVWDSLGDDIHSLPVDIRNELNEAYSDMALANSITWLSIEMKRRSPSLDESYTRLRNSIFERLNRTKPQLERNQLTIRAIGTQKA